MVGQAASRAGGIERVTPDGARLIGLALEEYVKNLVSKAIHAASHRNIQFKDNEHREKVNDVKTQFKLLQGMFYLVQGSIWSTDRIGPKLVKFENFCSGPRVKHFQK